MSDALSPLISRLSACGSRASFATSQTIFLPPSARLQRDEAPDRASGSATAAVAQTAAVATAAASAVFTPSVSVRQTPMSIWYESSPAILSASSLMACTRVSSPANQPAFSSLDVMV